VIAALLLMLATPAPSAEAELPCASSQPAERLAGQWTGPFAGADWTFELTRNEKGWSGRYRTTRGPNWHPLERLSVSGGCVSFGLPSQPPVSFHLTLGSDGRTLAGQIAMAGHLSLPFSAVRGS